MRVVLSKRARAGLLEIGLFIGRDNKGRAVSFVRELEAKARELAEMPMAFRLVPGF